MSERGSFITEYIHCDQCLETAKTVLIEGRFLDREEVEWVREPSSGWSVVAASYRLWTKRVLAGVLHHSFLGAEQARFEGSVIADLEEHLCHPLHIAVMGEIEKTLYRIEPASTGRDTQILRMPDPGGSS